MSMGMGMLLFVVMMLLLWNEQRSWLFRAWPRDGGCGVDWSSGGIGWKWMIDMLLLR